jgi:putative ABC transport system substrate-binding protein
LPGASLHGSNPEPAHEPRSPQLPGIQFVEAGGLISYGINLVANWDRIVALVDKILKGEQVANIPVEFPTKIELLINLKTAKALGLHIDDLNLLRCTKVTR